MLFNTQEEREALIKLMLVARFTDKKLTLFEQKTFKNILKDVEWQDVISSESFVNEQTSHVRKVVGETQDLHPFVTEQCQFFKDDEAKQMVLKKVGNVMRSDGLVESEQEIFEFIEQELQKV